MRVCSMANCSRPTSQYGKLCSAHRNHQRRHGDPLQIPVTKQDLKPYLRLIQERRKRNTDSPLWGMIDSRWLSVVDNAQQSLRLARSGKAGNRHGRLAAAAIEQLSQTSDRTEIADTAMAMFILQEFEPRRFVSDRAFWHQLARRTIRVGDIHSGSRIDHSSNRMRLIYRDAPAEVTLALGKLFVDVFGMAGSLLAKKEIEEAKRRRNEIEDIAQAVRELK